MLRLSGIHSHSHRPQQSPDHNHLNTDHPHLQPSISTPSNTRFTQTLIVRSTVHYPEQFPDPVCIYLCRLTFSDSRQSPHDSPTKYSCVPGSRSPFLQRNTHISIQLRLSGLFYHQDSHLLFAPLNLLPITVNKSSCYSTYLLFLPPFMTEDRTWTDTSMDPWSPSPSDILEELVNTLRALLMPAPNPQSASASPMAMPASYTGDSA